MQIFTGDCFAGRHVLVTGASSGLGRATAQALSDCGARLTLLGRDEARLEETLSALSGRDHSKCAAAFSDLEATADLVKSLASKNGAFDGVFHSAGTELVRPTRMLKNEHAAQLFDAAIYGSLGIARAAASKGVVQDGAALVFMSSVAGLRGTMGMAGYSAAKAAVDGMVRSLACELAPRRVRVNSVAAGAVLTEMHNRLGNSLGEAGMLAYEKRHLLGFGQPADIAHVVMFLLSPGGQWITGTTMIVDGGYTAQ